MCPSNPIRLAKFLLNWVSLYIKISSRLTWWGGRTYGLMLTVKDWWKIGLLRLCSLERFQRFKENVHYSWGQWIFLFLSELGCSPLEFNSRKFSNIWHVEHGIIKVRWVWNDANSFHEWRPHCHPLWLLKPPITILQPTFLLETNLQLYF